MRIRKDLEFMLSCVLPQDSQVSESLPTQCFFWERAKETLSLDVGMLTAACKPLNLATDQVIYSLVLLFCKQNSATDVGHQCHKQNLAFQNLPLQEKNLNEEGYMTKIPSSEVSFCSRISHFNAQSLHGHRVGHQENTHPFFTDLSMNKVLYFIPIQRIQLLKSF